MFPDDRLSATLHKCGASHQPKLWHAQTQFQIGVALPGPGAGLLALTFTPDGSATDRGGSAR
ncbi:hypothetical protein RKD49_007834 [Streptomyces glaucescens]